MIDGQFEVDGYVFGTGAQWRVASFDPGERVVVTSDTQLPFGGGRLMGRDREDGPEWAFLLKSSEDVEGEALAALARLNEAWAAPSAPLVTVPLRYRTAGRERLVWGRPRALGYSGSPVDRGVGLISVTCIFQRSDPLHYTDVVSSLDLGIVPASLGVIVPPVTPPISWFMVDGATSRQVVVGA